jgi:transposase-like protein
LSNENTKQTYIRKECIMNCPKCNSTNIVIAVAGNGFGSWKCNNCNESGTYPPSGVSNEKRR